jgi:hypothetical protein
MRRTVVSVLLGLCVSVSAIAANLGSSAQTAIPADVQQIIGVDYRTLNNSQTALALKDRVLPDNVKHFEGALRGVGIDPTEQLHQIFFVSFREPDAKGLRVIGIAQGQFSKAAVLKRLRAKKIRGKRVEEAVVYPMGGMEMSFLDPDTLLFGESAAVKSALQVRSGQRQSFASNRQISNMVADVGDGAVWSVLDQQGTQTMMRSALGDAAGLADYEVVKKRILGSIYTMEFRNGVNFDLDVFTSDSFTAATLSSILQAGMLYKKMNATATEKLALESVTVDSSSDRLRLHFKSDDQRFQSLLSSDMFAAVTR